MIPNRCCDEISILSAYSITFALLPASCLINDVMPIIAFIGVRCLLYTSGGGRICACNHTDAGNDAGNKRSEKQWQKKIRKRCV